jgi:tetratricopeptide (TPR) repeat protein
LGRTTALDDLASALEQQERYAEALDVNLASTALRPWPNPTYPLHLFARANLRLALGQGAAAIAELDDALVLFRKASPDHPAIPFALVSRADALRQTGRFEDAARELDRAFAERTRILGAPDGDDPEIGRMLRVRGELELERGRAASAVAALEQALPLVEGQVGYRLVHARVAFALARALVANGGNRARAIELAHLASEDYTHSGSVLADEHARAIAAWLASLHGARHKGFANRSTAQHGLPIRRAAAVGLAGVRRIH